jgi:hypothetical protein
MRKILYSLLLATTVATPALAQQTTRDDRATARQERHAEQVQAREERSQAREQVRAERVQTQAPQRMAPERNVTPPSRLGGGGGAYVNERGQPTLDRQQVRDNMIQDREQMRMDRQQLRENRQPNMDARDRFVARPGRITPPTNARPDRPAPPPPTAYNNVQTPQWSTRWRNDQRYDWQNYRRHHRSIFHLGIYYDPFGWGYQRWGIGWRLWPSYYSDNYWLDDPAYYALPYAPWPLKWVRYYDDALLVNVYTGEVVDVMYDFFW